MEVNPQMIILALSDSLSAFQICELLFNQRYSDTGGSFQPVVSIKGPFKGTFVIFQDMG